MFLRDDGRKFGVKVACFRQTRIITFKLTCRILAQAASNGRLSMNGILDGISSAKLSGSLLIDYLVFRRKQLCKCTCLLFIFASLSIKLRTW